MHVWVFVREDPTFSDRVPATGSRDTDLLIGFGLLWANNYPPNIPYSIYWVTDEDHATLMSLSEDLRGKYAEDCCDPIH